ncbi:hypothetical protein CY34DRAFT_99522 [Suillus luteus UH-Slu-Lm8-n1]|uniref:DDE Tnp4 domain-containing protein n=1 Tax=Suillus luteus UH-Slu-Lm8-n1 TaxID=930992 RepID=A0A0D0AGX2_9AGAM|nr:hypothetical protein CY34DRAFT_99522 [Suillus luteus UH-Slu-Lm8-n1]
MSQLSGLSSSHSDTSDYSDDVGVHYDRLQHTIAALRDEVERACIFHKPDQPPPRAPQLHMLVHHKEHRPHLFRQKLRVNPEIFDNILDQISDHPIFHNQSNNPQLPVSIQLAIFLNRAGHYGNAISLEDVAQWAGVSVGSVINCTNRVMVALLEEHDQFIFFPDDNSEDAELAWRFAETRTCPEWRGGYLAIDGSTMDLFAKPAYFGETFYDRKSKYSLGCQAVIMPHNLMIVDYCLGQPGSVHDAYAFKSTRLYEEHANLLPDGHWVWADSAYPLEPWCIPPFKKPHNG